MGKLGLKDLSDAMKSVDVCMMTTQGDGLESRPMSNNRDVDYKGDSYFFTEDKAELVHEIEAHAGVNLGYVHSPKLVGTSLYISVVGKADIVRDKEIMRAHWTPDLEVWFKDGVDTPGLAMVHVKAQSVKYWQGEDHGEVKF